MAVNTWNRLATRHGQLIEMAATLRRASRDAGRVLDDFPMEAGDFEDLEEAVVSLRETADRIDLAARGAS
jgi:phosphoribulokinase